jgi:hypothetical protein
MPPEITDAERQRLTSLHAPVAANEFPTMKFVEVQFLDMPSEPNGGYWATLYRDDQGNEGRVAEFWPDSRGLSTGRITLHKPSPVRSLMSDLNRDANALQDPEVKVIPGLRW